MSLNWDITHIKDHSNLCWLPNPTKEDPGAVRLNPTTDALIWATMSVDIGDLSEKNLDEFTYRVFFYERAFQSFLNQGGDPLFLTAEEIKAHVGLRTNVSFETRSKWETRMKSAWLREAQASARRAIERSKLQLV
jgi:hypothetical protein